jgi:hypothetical protein
MEKPPVGWGIWMVTGTAVKCAAALTKISRPAAAPASSAT